MPHSNIIPANTEEETWQIIADQLQTKKDNRDYTAQANFEDHCITIDIDFHPDSAHETEHGTTLFTAPLPEEVNFRFCLTRQDFKSGIKKLFGMQDVVVGNEELDKKFIIQTNKEDKIKEILSRKEVAGKLLELPVLNFELRELKLGANKEVVLSLDIEGRVKEAQALKEIFIPFKAVMDYLK
jgi:hypothetical protein